jgi:putative oxidoreductase
LIARIVFGILLMNHGIQKWTNFQELSAVFPDPLGVGSPLSLGNKSRFNIFIRF